VNASVSTGYVAVPFVHFSDRASVAVRAHSRLESDQAGGGRDVPRSIRGKLQAQANGGEQCRL